jgi:hypothetical protein
MIAGDCERKHQQASASTLFQKTTIAAQSQRNHI